MNTTFFFSMLRDPLARNSGLVCVAAAAVAIFVANPPPPPTALIRPAVASTIGEWPTPATRGTESSRSGGIETPAAPIQPRPQTPELTPAAPIDRFLAR
jgi:hypothetical protein